MEHKKILEFALETLEKQKAGIDAEIEAIRAELNSAGPKPSGKVRPIAKAISKRRLKTQAERKALSRKMKEIWAAKRLQGAKPSIAAKVLARARRRPKTKAEKKRLSLKMKRVWSRKKAEAAKKQPPKK